MIPFVIGGEITLFNNIGKTIRKIKRCYYYPHSKMLNIYLLDGSEGSERLIIDSVEWSDVISRGYTPYLPTDENNLDFNS